MYGLFTFIFQYDLRPTFKTATSTSRTQLKQQLQREQLQELERQEHERRETERKLSLPNSAADGHGAATSSTGAERPTNFPLSSPQLQMLSKPNHQSSSNMFMPSSSSVASTSSSEYMQTQTYPNQMAMQPTLSAPLKVPLHIGVDLPPQVLKVTPSFIMIFGRRKYSRK